MLDFDLMLAAAALEKARQSWVEAETSLGASSAPDWQGSSARCAEAEVAAVLAEGANIRYQLDEAIRALQVAAFEIEILRAGQAG